jgi:uncharacterized membrane protein YcaP (DUF421 family)
MESVIRALVVYVVLLVIFRIAGKRTLSQASAFELVLLLIISETVQEALVDGDHSMTNAFLLVMTLVGTSIGLSLLKQRWPGITKWLDGLPFLVVRKGAPVQEVMQKARIDEQDVLASARATQGLSRMDQIEHAVVEENGEISVVPRKNAS